MKYSSILSEEFKNLNSIAENEKNNYLSATPFPNAVFNNFFDKNFLNKVLDEFPDLKKLSNSQNYDNKKKIKLSNNK